MYIKIQMMYRFINRYIGQFQNIKRNTENLSKHNKNLKKNNSILFVMKMIAISKIMKIKGMLDI
jgi:hypothetical protein